MRRAVAEADVFRWADGFLTELDQVRARRPAPRLARVAANGDVAVAPMSRRQAMG